MGYTTEFKGSIKIDKPLDYETLNLLKGLKSINNQACNSPKSELQCIIDEDNQSIIWDDVEKFYNYIEWMECIISKIIAPRGYICNGEIYWSGEESGDLGVIRVINNVIC